LAVDDRRLGLARRSTAHRVADSKMPRFSLA
jgi:hypothetical protein